MSTDVGSCLPAFSPKTSNRGKCSTLITAQGSCSKAAADPVTRLVWRTTEFGLKITNLTWNYSKNEVHKTLQFTFPRAYSSTQILKTGHEQKNFLTAPVPKWKILLKWLFWILYIQSKSIKIYTMSYCSAQRSPQIIHKPAWTRLPSCDISECIFADNHKCPRHRCINFTFPLLHLNWLILHLLPVQAYLSSDHLHILYAPGMLQPL